MAPVGPEAWGLPASPPPLSSIYASALRAFSSACKHRIRAVIGGVGGRTVHVGPGLCIALADFHLHRGLEYLLFVGSISHCQLAASAPGVFENDVFTDHMGPTKALDPRNKGVTSVWPVPAGLIQHAD